MIFQAHCHQTPLKKLWAFLNFDGDVIQNFQSKVKKKIIVWLQEWQQQEQKVLLENFYFVVKIDAVVHIEIYIYCSTYDYYVVNFVWNSNTLGYFEWNIKVFVQVAMMKNNWDQKYQYQTKELELKSMLQTLICLPITAYRHCDHELNSTSLHLLF